MARPREFETQEAVDLGMHLLWERGYEATSLDDLLAAMKLSKSSFYETFGSKHEFLITALTRYIDLVIGQLEEDLQQGSARVAISRSFERMLPSREASPQGCFVHNCAMELAQRDPEARAKVSEGLNRLERGYYRAVLRGQERGEFRRKQDARVLARFLVSSLNGIQVFARAGFERKDLHQIVAFALGMVS